MPDPVALIFGPEYRQAPYTFGPSHPLQPIRVELAVELIRASGLLEAPGVTMIPPRPATEVELSAVHSKAYIETVKAISPAGEAPAEWARRAARHGFAQGDNPAFPRMHEASALVAGGTVAGMEEVMEGRALHAFVPAGGLHHAHHDRAAGFCVYNDPAAAIQAARDRFDARVVYIDVDAHHGDGVQEAFYADPNVLTISMHESGLYLFPGTGFVGELGEGAAYGTSVNAPLEPYTTDAPFLRVVEEVVLPLARAFRPDLIVTQCGCDSHWLDPITHLACSTAIWPVLGRQFHQLAHEVCGGRWLATGGGGYDLYSVVPRAWTMLFAAMIERELPPDLPRAFLELRAQHATHPMDASFLDEEVISFGEEREARVAAATGKMIQQVRELVFPLHGL
ncbi:MAG TPA: acetoin utilization protein AcuC [Chloroflexota bacterium]|nr:acetoin utilization protein AcuC [Chloroflexota bacterium]